MCFSAEVSFTSAAVLTGIGLMTLKKVSARSQLYLAVIPFLFALQQISEGVLWLALSQGWGGSQIIDLGRYSFLMFAFCTWPWWFPLSLSQIEVVPQRKNILYGFLAVGLALCLYNFYYLYSHGMGVQIIGHSIQYTNTLPKEGPLYLALVCLPWAVSSARHAMVCAVVGFVSFVVTYFFYWETFTSVWCFFAAIISLIVYFIVRDDKRLA